MSGIIFNKQPNCKTSETIITGAWQQVSVPAGVPLGSGNADVSVLLSTRAGGGIYSGSPFLACTDPSPLPTATSPTYGLLIPGGTIISYDFNNSVWVKGQTAGDVLTAQFRF